MAARPRIESVDICIICSKVEKGSECGVGVQGRKRLIRDNQICRTNAWGYKKVMNEIRMGFTGRRQRKTAQSCWKKSLNTAGKRWLYAHYSLSPHEEAGPFALKINRVSVRYEPLAILWGCVSKPSFSN